MTSALADQEARHGQLTGSPGGAPVAGGGRFVVSATTKAAASGKDPRGDKNLLFCRKCSSWPCKLGKQGKTYNGAIHVCPSTLDFHHGEYHDTMQISAYTLANMCHIGGCLALPMTETHEKQQKAHDLLMTDGATRSYKEWKTWGAGQHFGRSSAEESVESSSAEEPTEAPKMPLVGESPPPAPPPTSAPAPTPAGGAFRGRPSGARRDDNVGEGRRGRGNTHDGGADSAGSAGNFPNGVRESGL